MGMVKIQIRGSFGNKPDSETFVADAGGIYQWRSA